MKKRLILFLLPVIACLAGCNNQEPPVKYTVTKLSDTLNINVVNEIEKGQNLTFEVSLTQDSETKGYLLPNENTTFISVGKMLLEEGNYVYNIDSENNKGLFFIPACFINDKVTLTINAYIPEMPEEVELKFENNNTPLQLNNQDKPFMGVDFNNRLEAINGETLRYGLPEKIRITCKGIDGETDTLINGQYFYEAESGSLFIPGQYVMGDLTIYAEAIDYFEKKIEVHMISDNTLNYKIEGNKQEIHFNDDLVSLSITPIDGSYILPTQLDGVTINGVSADYLYEYDNEYLGRLSIRGKITGDINIYAKGTKIKAVKVYSGGATLSDIVAIVNPNLVIGAPVYAYLSPKNPAQYKLPTTLESVETLVPDNEGKLVVYTFKTSEYYYDSTTGLFIINDKNLVTNSISITANPVAK